MLQDHGHSPDVCQGAINLGFSSVIVLRGPPQMTLPSGALW
jgi:hypothetical protein